MNAKIQENQAIEIPSGLELTLDQLVAEYARSHREAPAECRRGVEIAVLQRGMRALRDELKANAALGDRYGWLKEEGENV